MLPTHLHDVDPTLLFAEAHRLQARVAELEADKQRGLELLNEAYTNLGRCTQTANALRRDAARYRAIREYMYLDGQHDGTAGTPLSQQWLAMGYVDLPAAWQSQHDSLDAVDEAIDTHLLPKA